MGLLDRLSLGGKEGVSLKGVALGCKGHSSRALLSGAQILTVSKKNLSSLSIFLGRGEDHDGVFLSNGE